MVERIETAIGGGGQAGFALSYYLTQEKRENIVLEQAAQPAEAWRNQRWDSFTLLTPNWSLRLPGAEYHGNYREGFLTRREVIAYFEQYVERYRLPVRYATRVISVEQKSDGAYRVTTNRDEFDAQNVVLATGLYQTAKIPAYTTNFPPKIKQLHSNAYRNPRALPPGAVLVVGSAQSGCQIAEELYQSRRQVYLCVGGAGRVPRRYRGKDTYEWLNLVGFFDRPPNQLPSPQAKFAGNPHVSGKDGGHTLNPHKFARDGVILLRRIQDARDGKITLAPDLKENLARADKFEANLLKMIDDYIAGHGLRAPTEQLPHLSDGYAAPTITELYLKISGINTIIWALGYRFDFTLVRLPVCDSDGYPIQTRGVTQYPGLFFLGLPWLHKQKSGLLLGVGDDAAHIASKIIERTKGLSR